MLNNRCVSMAIAIVVLLVKQAPVKPAAPLLAYAAVSVSNVIATTCQYEALRYVSFPVQTLGKCAKMIPVMIWGRLMIGRRYGLGDYLVAAAVTSGATVFMLGGDVSSSASKHHKAGASTSIYGCLLMVGYLGCDGFTSTLQDKLFKGYSMETFNQMLWVTGCSAAISVVWLLGGAQAQLSVGAAFQLVTRRTSDSSMGEALAFVSRHPDCLSGIWMLSLSSAIGQLFILVSQMWLCAISPGLISLSAHNQGVWCPRVCDGDDEPPVSVHSPFLPHLHAPTQHAAVAGDCAHLLRPLLPGGEQEQQEQQARDPGRGGGECGGDKSDPRSGWRGLGVRAPGNGTLAQGRG